MRSSLAISAFAAATANAQLLGLDIPGLLAGIGPAPASDPRFRNHVPPGPNDVRSPCPGLNALANHGFIHHDGRNMNIPHLLEGLAAGLNMASDFTVAIAGAGLLASKNPASGAFDLDDLAQHNFPIEHDGSLSRRDKLFGNNAEFFQPNWDMVLDVFGDDEFTSIESATTAKYTRVNESMNTNPEMVYGIREFILSYGETALYLQGLGSPSSDGVTSMDYVRILFEEERLPFAEGWRVSPEAITLSSLGVQILQLYSQGPEPLPEGATVTVDSLRNVFIAAAGGSLALARLTSGISSVLGL